METKSQKSLKDLQDAAFARIRPDSLAYINSDIAMAIYVQGALFDLNASHEAASQDLATRERWMRGSDDDIILLSGELDELRYRAAYHGAGLATEPYESIPRAIHGRLSDNLSNYMPDMNFERTYMPWGYKFKKGDLGSVLAHDY